MRDITYDEVVSQTISQRGVIGVSSDDETHVINVYVEDKPTKLLIQRKIKFYAEEEDDVSTDCVHVLIGD